STSHARRRVLIATIRESVAELCAHRSDKSLGIASSLEAVLALEHGDRAACRNALARAAGILEAAGIAMFAAATRRRLGQLIGGADGDVLIAAADAAMRAEEVENIEAMTHLNCPGCCP
ncbi:MAG TPA: hypothetical protein VFK05_26390, partial [Polyangiaceae bacterium]|nr:hypothetical protein [Polyangiaceae bacterium]